MLFELWKMKVTDGSFLMIECLYLLATCSIVRSGMILDWWGKVPSHASAHLVLNPTSKAHLIKGNLESIVYALVPWHIQSSSKITALLHGTSTFTNPSPPTLTCSPRVTFCSSTGFPSSNSKL